MTNITEIKPSMDIAGTLRRIADDIDKGVVKPDNVTLIALPHVYQIGTFDDGAAATETIFNCNFAIHKLMDAALGDFES